MSQLNINSYIEYVHDNHWFFGTNLSKHDKEVDVKVKCMHLFELASSSHWPSGKEDLRYVPFCNIIHKVRIPDIKGSG